MDLSGITLEQVDELERQGQLAPETARALRAKTGAAPVFEPVDDSLLFPPSETPEGGSMTPPLASGSADLSKMQLVPDSPETLPMRGRPAAVPAATPEQRRPAQQNSAGLEVLQGEPPKRRVAAPVAPKGARPPAARGAPRRAVDPQAEVKSAQETELSKREAIIDKELAAQDKAYQAATEIEERRRDLGLRKVETDAEIRAAEARKMGELEINQAMEEEEINHRLDKHRQRYEELTEKLATHEIDPNRYLDRNKMVAGLAMAFGELGRAFTQLGGGTQQGNVGADMIERMIERDIAAQTKDREGIKGALTAESNLVSMFEQELGDARAAVPAAKAAIADQYLRLAESLYDQKGIRSEEAAIAADATMNALREQKDKNETEAARQLQLVETDRVKYARQNMMDEDALANSRSNRATQAASRALSREQIKAARAKAQQQLAGEGPVTIDGMSGRPRNEKHLDQAIEIKQRYNVAMDTTRDIQQAIKDLSWIDKMSPAMLDQRKAALATSAQALKGELNKYFKFGAMDAGTTELLDAMIGGDLAAMKSAIPSAKLDSVAAHLNRSAQGMLRPLNMGLDHMKPMGPAQ